MTKISPEKNLAIDHKNDQKETLIFEIDKTDANEKYEIQAFKKDRFSRKRTRIKFLFEISDYGEAWLLYVTV